MSFSLLGVGARGVLTSSVVGLALSSESEKIVVILIAGVLDFLVASFLPLVLLVTLDELGGETGDWYLRLRQDGAVCCAGDERSVGGVDGLGVLLRADRRTAGWEVGVAAGGAVIACCASSASSSAITCAAALAAILSKFWKLLISAYGHMCVSSAIGMMVNNLSFVPVVSFLALNTVVWNLSSICCLSM